jgi:hypothetical protein
VSGAYAKPLKLKRGERVMKMTKTNKKVLVVLLLMIGLAFLPMILFPSLFRGGQVDAKQIAKPVVGSAEASKANAHFPRNPPEVEI